MKTIEERFWSKVDKKEPEDCWLWKAYSQGKYLPYGRMGYKDGKLILAHRLSYILNKGDPGNLCVLHKCDNSLCVNPDHLFLGTHEDNMKDKVNKNRQSKMPGSTHPSAKLSEQDVIEIKKRLSDGETLKSIAKKYNVHFSTISYIKIGKLWQHLNY